MTFVGKILVVFIMVFALIFLAFSTVVFTTEKNWKDEAEKLTTEISKKKDQIKSVQAELANQVNNLKIAKEETAKQEGVYKGRISDLEAQGKARATELEDTRKSVETSQQAMRAAQDEAVVRRKETDNLRAILSEVQKQANDYGLRQTELNDEIRVLKRQLETATGNNKDLRERVNVLASELRRNGLSDDYVQLKTVANQTTSPPAVEGYVKRIDSRNRRVEISLGSDDGLVVGHELDVWRTKPTAEYLGKIRIESVEADQAVGQVIGKTVLGKKIEEGDYVAPTIRPRQ